MKKYILLTIILLQIVTYSFAQSAERIFYSSMRPEGWDIYIVKDNSEAFEQFTFHPALDYDATLSPDGKWVVFTSERDGDPRLFIKPVEGNQSARLLISSNAMQDQANISPDGKLIVFVSTHEGYANIYKMPFVPDSTLQVDSAINLTNHASGNFRPSFSPDGETIVFSSDRDHLLKPHSFFSFAVHRTGDIYSINKNGAELRRLTNTDSWDGSPVFSEDGKSIYFYSERSGEAKIYSMNPDGSNQVQINKKGPKTISPTLLRNKIITSTWNRNSGDFRLASIDRKTGEVEKFLNSEIDMLNPMAHKSGILVFHGGKKPEEMENNRGGFAGNLLVASGGGNIDLDGLPVQTFGVRRAFAAPPDPQGPFIIIEHLAMENVLSDISLLGFVGAFILLGILLLALSGIVLAIIKRKKVRFWRFLLYSFGSLLIFLVSFGSYFYLVVFLGLPMLTASIYLVVMGLVFSAFAWYAYKTWKSRQIKEIPHYKVARLMTVTLGLAAFFFIFSAAFQFWFFDVRHDFYKVNYVTNEVEHLFKIEPDININPGNRQILDMKYKPDRSGFIITMGRFGSEPRHQGDIYEYDFDTREVTKLSDSDENVAFGAYSEDMKQFVYRSGRMGNMDLFLRRGDKEEQLTFSKAKENFPALSLQGDKIVYCSDEAASSRENNVRSMNIFMIQKLKEGWSKPVEITSNETLEAHPHFSPDGEWITYTTEEFGIMDEQPLVQHFIFAPQMYGEIMAHRLKDGKKIRLTHNKWEDGAPIWEKALREEVDTREQPLITSN